MKLVMLCISLLLVGATQAGTDVPWWQILGVVDEATASSDALFTEDEKHIIRSYFQEQQGYHYGDSNESGRGKPKKKKNLPPGLQKKLERGGELPPGWQRKVARGEVLDAGLYMQSRSLPEELLQRLPPEVDNAELRWLGDRVIRVVDGTRAILDVMQID